MCGISIAGVRTARSASARHAQLSYQSPKRTMRRSLGSPCLAACIMSIIWRHDASGKVFAPYKSMETTVERIVIMPATVGQRRKNLQLFSVLRSFEQAQERIVIMPTTVWRWRKNFQAFSAFRSFERRQALIVRHGMRHAAKERS